MEAPSPSVTVGCDWAIVHLDDVPDQFTERHSFHRVSGGTSSTLYGLPTEHPFYRWMVGPTHQHNTVESEKSE